MAAISRQKAPKRGQSAEANKSKEATFFELRFFFFCVARILQKKSCKPPKGGNPEDVHQNVHLRADVHVDVRALRPIRNIF